MFSGAMSWMVPLSTRGSVVIGRGDTADIRIDHGAVSRQHARLALDGDAVAIFDLGSHHGTFVNKIRVDGRQMLQPNDVITIHGTTLVFQAVPTEADSAVVHDMTLFRRYIDNELEHQAA